MQFSNIRKFTENAAIVTCKKRESKITVKQSTTMSKLTATH